MVTEKLIVHKKLLGKIRKTSVRKFLIRTRNKTQETKEMERGPKKEKSSLGEKRRRRLSA